MVSSPVLKNPVRLILFPIVAVAAATFITVSWQPPNGHPFFLFVFVVVGVTVLTEWRAGWLATFLSALSLDYFFCPPLRSLGIGDLSNGAQLAIFTVGSALLSSVVGKWNILSSLIFSEVSHILPPAVRRLGELERIDQCFEAMLGGLEHVVAVLVDPAGNIEKCYKASKDLIGQPGPELVGEPLQRLLPGLTAERLKEYLTRAVEARRAEVVTECQHKNGTSRTVVLVLTPIYDIEHQSEMRGSLPYTIARDKPPGAYFALVREIRGLDSSM